MQRDEPHAGDAGKRRQILEREGARDVGFRVGVALPDAADAKAVGADLLGPARYAIFLREQIGDGGGHAVEPRAEGARQARNGDLRVELHLLRLALEDAAAERGADEAVELGRAEEMRFGPRRDHHREIAGELDGVAEPVIIDDQHALRRRGGAAPQRIAHAERLGDRLAVDPTRLIAFPAALEIAEHEIETAEPALRLAAAELHRARERCPRLVEAVERAQRQTLSADRVGIVAPLRDGLGESRERRPDLTRFQQRRAEIDRGLRKNRPPLERRARGDDGIVKPPQRAQHRRAGVERIGVVGRELGALVQRRQRLDETTLARQQLGEVEPGRRQRRLEIEGALVEAQRRLGLAATFEDIGAQTEGLGEVRPQRQGGVEAAGGFRVAPLVDEPARLFVERQSGIADLRSARHLSLTLRSGKIAGCAPSLRQPVAVVAFEFRLGQAVWR